MKINRAITYSVIMVAASISTAVPPSDLISIEGKPIQISEMEAAICGVMDKAGVTGLSCAIINDTRVAYCKAFGLKDRKTGERNDERTIFASASLSKTVFAYMVMLLVEDGVIDFDKPLYEYLKKSLPDYKKYAGLKGDNRYRQVTARLCLTHSSGLVNQGSGEDTKMTFLFDPGQRYKYSGGGIQLLQMVIEEVTGESLEELARAKVFEPLGMMRTSYVWQDIWKENVATSHDQYERPQKPLFRTQEPFAAASMCTTASDYARLLVAIISAEGKRKTTMDEMLRSQVSINSQGWFNSEQTDKYEPIHLAWALGWVRFDTKYGRAFFHIGRFRGWQCYTVTYADKGIGVVFLSNSDNFESVARELAKVSIGDTYTPFDWCGYPYYDPGIPKESRLHLAAYFGQRDIVQSLLNKGADYRSLNRDGRTAMGLAQEKGHTDIVGLFSKHARQSGDSSNIMTFFDYAAVKDTERIKSNISQGIDINARTHFGMTPLHLAISKGYKSIAHLLIEKGANCQAEQKDGMTPLHISAARGYIDIIKLLIEKGVNVNANTNRWSGTPLHLAADRGHIDCVELLVTNGANINSRNSNNATPLHWAAGEGHTNVVELLLNKGAEVNAENEQGSTPLDFAMDRGHVETIKLLRKYGASE